MPLPIKRFSGFRLRTQEFRTYKEYFCVIGEVIRETDIDYFIRLLFPQQLNWMAGWTIPTRFYSFGKDQKVRIYVENQHSLVSALQETPRENAITWTSMTDVDPICPICYDNNIAIGTLCGHGFCNKCVFLFTTNICPMCRQNLIFPWNKYH